MARFYARFDSGSGGWNPTSFPYYITTATLLADNAGGRFDTRSIAANSASAALLRDGLIASRSIVATDVYAELDSVNQDGSKGTYFPPNAMTVPNNPFTATAYTSSIPGIVIPSDYRTRPTSSVRTTTPGVAITNPQDDVTVSYTSYINASTAVKAVLDSIQGGGPFARLGNNQSRTLHSIWHDPDLQYFAWDDFTPGPPANSTLQALNPLLCINPTTIGGASVRFIWYPTYKNDFNPEASASIKLYLDYPSSPTEYSTSTLADVILDADNGQFDFAVQFTTSSFAESGRGYSLRGEINFFDAVIKTSAGATVQPTGIGGGLEIAALDCQDTPPPPPPPTPCSNDGVSCGSNVECCSGFCDNGFCAEPCGGFGDECTSNGDCCSNFCRTDVNPRTCGDPE